MHTKNKFLWSAQYHWLTHVSTPEEVGVLGETELLQLLLTQLVNLTTKMLLDLMEMKIIYFLATYCIDGNGTGSTNLNVWSFLAVVSSRGQVMH